MTQTPLPVRVPDELLDLLTDGVLGHVTWLTPKGRLNTAVMWIDYDGDHLLTSSRTGSAKGGAFRIDPRVSVSVVDRDDPWRYVEISGRVTDIKPDTDLAFIDKLSRRYTGQAYRFRDWEREIFVITPERIRTSTGRR